MANYNAVISGLSTPAQMTIAASSNYAIDCKLQLPTLMEGAAADSQVIATVSQNGSPIYTSNAGDRGLHFTAALSAADVLSVALSSAAAVDQGPNLIKCTVAVG